MTLILTAIAPRFVVQVADKLVSKKFRGKVSSYDELSNKSIILVTHDGIFTIGYAGLAYINGQPTDNWLVNIIDKHALGPGKNANRPPAHRFGGPHVNYKIFNIVWRIKNAIAAIQSTAINQEGIEISIAGWWLRRKRYRPISIEIRSFGGSTNLIRGPIFWPQNKNFAIYSIGQTLNQNFLQSHLTPIKLSTKKTLTACGMENIFVDCIRKTSISNVTVGNQLMSTILLHPYINKFTCKFIPYHNLSNDLAKPKQYIGFTPWVLTPNMPHPPREIIGKEFIEIGDIKILIDGPPPVSPILGMSRSQVRPPPP